MLFSFKNGKLFSHAAIFLYNMFRLLFIRFGVCFSVASCFGHIYTSPLYLAFIPRGHIRVRSAQISEVLRHM